MRAPTKKLVTAGKGPAHEPCRSCPYRRDVPPAVWSRGEYERLPGYDKPTGEQPVALFLCHKVTGHLCGGWIACHDPDELLSLRITLGAGLITEADMKACQAYTTDVPVFATGQEAYEHGIRDIENPSEEAIEMAYEAERIHEQAQCRGLLAPLTGGQE